MLTMVLNDAGLYVRRTVFKTISNVYYNNRAEKKFLMSHVRNIDIALSHQCVPCNCNCN